MKFLLLIIFLLVFSAIVYADNINQKTNVKYLKGSLHMHTTMSDGEVSPEEAAKIYKSLGFDFFTYTDHNKNYDPLKYIKKPLKDFIYFSGEETDFSYRNHFENIACVHLNGIDFLDKFIEPEVTEVPETIENYIK